MGGAVAAFVVGTVTFASGGWAFTAVLLAFFVSSVALSRVGRARKKALVDIGKGGARDALQVIANGGVATLCALAVRGPPAFVDPVLWTAAFAGAYAAATADTWGTEIGTLVRGAPRSILTLRPVAAGLSGGVTRWGSLAEIAGAMWVAGVTVASVPRTFGLLFGPVAAGGVFGAIADSVLGATLQELRRCPVCDRTCETNPHRCGTPTTLVRGVAGCSNDVVNGAATFIGAAIAYGGAALIVALTLR